MKRIPFADRVIEKNAGDVSVMMLPTPIKDVVTFKGSFKIYPDFAAGGELLSSLAGLMLDKGTEKHDQFELATVLENIGARLNTTSGVHRVRFTGKCLKKDIPVMLDLIRERLFTSTFPKEAFEKMRVRVLANHQRSKEDTLDQALELFTNKIYPVGHPNRDELHEAEAASLQKVSVEEVAEFYNKQVNTTSIRMIFVGDLDQSVILAGLNKWPSIKSDVTTKSWDKRISAGGADKINHHMAGKANLDVILGHPVPLLRSDDDYLALYLGDYVLGGNFSSRLMSIVRDEMGLTYGIRSGVYGISNDFTGHWRTRITLSQENLEIGIEATQKVIRQFVKEGITEAELERCIQTLVGTFETSLGTTSGLAGKILTNADRNKSITELDQYTEKIASFTVDQVNGAIRKYLHPNKLTIVVAGSIPE